MTNNKLFKLILGLALSAAACFGQASMASTTLGAALSQTATTVTLASTSTMLNRGTSNQYDTMLYVDKELMGVMTVVDSTHVTVKRGLGVGYGANQRAHVNGAKVYFAITTVNGPAGNYFSNGSIGSEVSGACTATNELVLPKIYTSSADIFDCKSSGTWLLLGQGSLAAGGTPVRAFCTGTVGSAATDYLTGAACSSSTSSTTTYTIGSAGTLANFYATSSAAFVGTGGSTFTVLKNGSATAIVCAPTAAATTCNDLTHSVAVLPGDKITVSFLSATSDTAANLSIAVSVY